MAVGSGYVPFTRPLQNNCLRSANMNRVLLTLAITVLSGSLLFSNPTSAQFIPPAKKAVRVRITGLKPRTIYYYRVDSVDANGTSDGVISSVKTFTTR